MIFFKGFAKRKSSRDCPVLSTSPAARETEAKVSEMEQMRTAGVKPGGQRERIKVDILIHDLKGPLAVIEAGVMSLLSRPEKYGAITDKQERVLRRALRNTKITRTLVNDALELGRAREGIINISRFKVSDWVVETLVEIFDLAEGNLSERVRQCRSLGEVRQTLERNDVKLAVDDALWEEEILLDLPKATQILRNLLNNAFKYKKKLIEMQIARTDVNFVISVKDDGDGIPSEFHEKIFQCYFQLDPSDTCVVRGHGLGLAGVMVLVEDMGGTLFLDSDKGRGARFLVKLPLKSQG